MKSRLSLFAILIVLCSCNPRKPDDPRVAQLQKDVTELKEQNRRIEQGIQQLQEEMERTNEAAAAAKSQTVPADAPKPGMTRERMMAEVAPVLQETIRKMKDSSETPAKDNQYGMRFDYDIKHAVYGLVQSTAPYRAKVIVKYEKYLESANDSKSYGSGTTEFLFLYKNGKWSLESTK